MVTQNEHEMSLNECATIVLTNWRKELVVLARAMLEKYCPKTPIVEFSSTAIRVTEYEDDGTVTDIPIGPADTKEAARRLVRHFAGKRRNIRLLIPETYVLRSRIALPPTSRKSWREALRFEIDRVSPIDPDEIYYDFVPTADVASAALADAEVRIVRKKEVANLASICSSADLKIVGILLGGDQVAADRQAFPIEHLAFWWQELHRFAIPILFLVACVLMALVFSGAYLRAAVAQDRLIETVIDAGVRAARVERLEQQIKITTSDLGFPAQKKKASPLLVQTISELSRVLPDDTWVTQLALEGSKVRIQGVSGSASELLGRIDQSPLFDDAQFVAPVVHEQVTKGDHFDLAFDVRSPSR